jgi:hypothetical protein
MSSCEIKFDDNSLSRLQCQIEYRIYDNGTYFNDIDFEGQKIPKGTPIWVLTDGDQSSNKKSTNGTWLYVD